MRTVVVLLVCILLPVASKAADQTFSLNDPPKLVDLSRKDKDKKPLTTKDGKPLVDPQDGSIKVENVRALLEGLFGTEEGFDHPFIIHSVVWKSGLQVANGADHWYVYDPNAHSRSSVGEFFMNDEWTQKRFEGSRIYGRKTITLVYIHQHARGQHDPDKIKKAIADAIKKINPAAANPDSDAASALSALQAGKTTQYTFADASTNKTISLVCSASDGIYTGGCVDSQYTTVTYDVTVTKKTPQPLSDLRSAITIIAGQGAADMSVAIPMEDVTLWQSKELDAVLNPSTLAISGSAGFAPQTVKISNTTVTNEGKYWGGVSFAVPLNSYKDASFDDTSSTITPKTVKRENIYFVGNLYWPKLDLQEPAKRPIPHFLAGMPIKGSPLNHLMVGTGIGFNYVEPFAGIVFVHSKRPIKGVTAPTSSSQLQTHVNYKFIWGINMPVGSVAKLLSKSSGSTNSGK